MAEATQQQVADEKKAKNAGRVAGKRDAVAGKEFNPRQDGAAYVNAYTIAYEANRKDVEVSEIDQAAIDSGEVTAEDVAAYKADQERQDGMTIEELNEEAAEAMADGGPFAGMTEEEINQKMADDIAVEVLIAGELNGQTDGHPSVNEFGVKLSHIDAANFALADGRLAEDHYALFIKGEATYDEALEMTKALPSDQKPRKKASGNPDKRSKQRSKAEKAEKPKREPNPDNFYSAAGQIGYSGEINEKNMARKHNLVIGEKNGEPKMVHSVWISPKKLAEAAVESGALDAFKASGKWDPAEEKITFKGEEPTSPQLDLLAARYAAKSVEVK